MMDIQKEREAFEALQNQKIFKWFEFDSSVNAYVLKDISATLEKLTALAELNYGWDMWQAAKAQAVPEGFLLMPKDMTEDMVKSVWSSDYMLGFMRFRKSTFENSLRGAYRTIIKTQEQAND